MLEENSSDGFSSVSKKDSHPREIPGCHGTGAPVGHPCAGDEAPSFLGWDKRGVAAPLGASVVSRTRAGLWMCLPSIDTVWFCVCPYSVFLPVFHLYWVE